MTTAPRSRRSASVTLYEGDDFERLAELRREADHATALAERAAEKAAEDAGARAGDEPDPELAETARRKRAEYDAFVDVAAARATEVRFRAMPGKAFRALMVEHTPRPDHAVDAVYKVNTDTFPSPLLMECIEEPDLKNADRQAFIDDLADGDFETFWVTAYWLNRGAASDPKESRYSTASPSFETP